MLLKPVLKGRRQRKYIISNNLKDSKYCLSLKPCSFQNYYIGGVTPVLYPNNSDNRKSTKLTKEKVNQKNIDKPVSSSPSQILEYSPNGIIRTLYSKDIPERIEIKSINSPAILERIEANEFFLKKKHKTEASICVRKKCLKKNIKKKESKNPYLLPESKEDIEKKDIKKIIFSQPTNKLYSKYCSNSDLRLVADNFFKWMESIGQNEPHMTVSSLFNLLLSSFEIKPSLAINLQIINEKQLATGSRRYSTNLEIFTFGNEPPAYLEYFDKYTDIKDSLNIGNYYNEKRNTKETIAKH